MVYPPVDAHFYKLNHEAGMSDDEIEADWHDFVDGMNQYSIETSANQKEQADQERFNAARRDPKKFDELIREILSRFNK